MISEAVVGAEAGLLVPGTEAPCGRTDEPWLRFVRVI